MVCRLQGGHERCAAIQLLMYLEGVYVLYMSKTAATPADLVTPPGLLSRRQPSAPVHLLNEALPKVLVVELHLCL